MTVKKMFRAYLCAVALLVVSAALGVQLAAAQDTAQASYPVLELTVVDGAIEGPDSVEAAYYQLEISDASGLGADVVLARLKAGVSPEDFVGAYSAMILAGESPDAGRATQTLLTLIEAAVGGQSAPHSSVLRLEPGQYVAVSYGATEAGETHPDLGLYKAFEVTGDSVAAEPPDADLSVSMIDFGFLVPGEVPTGPQTWEIVNEGAQPHHLVLFKVEEGKSVEDVMGFMQAAPEEQTGPPPFMDAGYINVLTAGQSSYVDFDLEAGSYVAMCFIPDLETGVPHVAKGMIAVFTAVDTP